MRAVLIVMTVVGLSAALVLLALLVVGLGDRSALLVQFVTTTTGTAALAGIFAALRRADTHDRQLAVQQGQLIVQQGQLEAQNRNLALQEEQAARAAQEFREQHAANIRRAASERFAKASEALGNASRPVRTGGVYALEGVVADDPALHGAVVDLLSSFLQQHVRSPENDTEKAQQQYVAEQRKLGKVVFYVAPVDVHAAVAVLGRRDKTRDRRRLEFFKAHLEGIRGDDANFDGVVFFHCHMGGTSFEKVSFRGTRFSGSVMQAALFKDCDLTDARFDNVDLSTTSFHDCIVNERTFNGARPNPSLITTTAGLAAQAAAGGSAAPSP
jgi:predicted metal-dependent hydrolase